jgi:hypothetical protein
MKKIILTGVAILTLGLTSFAQECDVKVQVDSYTNERTIETDFIDFNGGMYTISKRSFGYALWLQLESSIPLIVEKGDIIYFKMSDNSVIKFITRKTDYGDYNTAGYTNSFGFLLDEEILEQMKNKEVIGIKCRVNEYIITPKQGQRLKNNINCIVNIK